jgi:site-specific DNA recombinase
MSKTRAPSPKSTAPAIRCAIYTRKSTEEGLEQEFNSLDSQRESGEAYIASQQQEGWTCLRDRYDDGGFTGGNLERPAMQRLMADIQAGQIDCVVVYKVDRLSRSLLDFVRLMETFDRHQVAFVSVTQQFNTATSMGRLVLNVLLSFAQFEREIISERTRDKIAAARRKGKWSGGTPLLGYDIDPRTAKLNVNDDEAVQIRTIFAWYLQHRGLIPVLTELQRCGWLSKRWMTRKGQLRGGQAFTKTRLHRMLTNVTYAGKVRHKLDVHPGEHAAIVDPEVWEKVQAVLRQNSRNPSTAVRHQQGALLQGLLHCVACRCAMTPTFATKNGSVRYRYYVCGNAKQRGKGHCPSKSVPAGEIERLLIEQTRTFLLAPALAETAADSAAWSDLSAFRAMAESLTAPEQARMVQFVVQRVDYDGVRGKVSTTFDSAGIKTLVDELAERRKATNACL